MNQTLKTTLKAITREDKEDLLLQRSKVVWLTGLSCAGKTTLAKHLEFALHQQGFITQVLDGDIVRSSINKNMDFTEKGRQENIRVIAEISKLLISSGIITINSFISPTEKIRQIAKDIIGTKDFIEILVDAPLEVCEQRDVKGLYKKARKGDIKNFTGIDSPFELPKNPDLIVDTSSYSIEECTNKILDFIIPKIKY
ncbi:MAG: adenylyl-sulfate kinase [Bacteroidales bacterium]|nr:adenylyl-sulfate kinase [Bacteroidales bacterium]